MTLLPLPLSASLLAFCFRQKHLPLLRNVSFSLFPLNKFPKLSSTYPVEQLGLAAATAVRNVSSDSITSSLSGVDDVLKGYISGEKKSTEVAHLVWKDVIKKGDTVVDATCGNGNDTLTMVKMVKDESGKGCVYGMDIQEEAINNTSALLDMSLNPTERKSVKLFSICHSRMAEVLPKSSSVKLVAFNLGYLPGGDKKIITKSDTTQLALQASTELLVPGGVITVVAYVGHSGGREEYETVRAFASELPVESWVCTQIQMINRPLAPILVILLKR